MLRVNVCSLSVRSAQYLPGIDLNRSSLMSLQGYAMVYALTSKLSQGVGTARITTMVTRRKDT